VAYIRDVLRKAGAKGVVYGNSGGKDCALVGILCKKATPNVLGVTMPCQSKRNYASDMEDALAVARQFDIETVSVDLTAAKEALAGAVGAVQPLAPMADANMNPRLRMTTLYSIAQSRGALVAGTGNRSEVFMGYFTKWGDGAYDFNPIADLTVTEIYEFLRYLEAPASIIAKKPSAGLYEGQTDEEEMGVSYEIIDKFILYGLADDAVCEKLTQVNRATAHKRELPSVYKHID